MTRAKVQEGLAYNRYTQEVRLVKAHLQCHATAYATWCVVVIACRKLHLVKGSDAHWGGPPLSRVEEISFEQDAKLSGILEGGIVITKLVGKLR